MITRTSCDRCDSPVTSQLAVSCDDPYRSHSTAHSTQTVSEGRASRANLPADTRRRAGRRHRLASLPGVTLALLLAGCGSSAVVTPTPTPTPTPSYSRGTVVDMEAYGNLVDFMDAVGMDGRTADALIETVCTAPQTPEELVQQASGARVAVRLAVLAGCPDRKDWTS